MNVKTLIENVGAWAFVATVFVAIPTGFVLFGYILYALVSGASKPHYNPYTGETVP